MISELLGTMFLVSLVCLLSYVLVLASKNRQKHQFFEKYAPNLRVLKNPSLFGGHSNKIHYAKHNWAAYERLFEEYGPTFGFYLNDKPAVATIDLEFIKAFTIDEQTHTNRIKLGLPMKEIEEDCIMFAEDEQWLRLRKAIAPAFTAHKIKSRNVQADIGSVIDKFIGLIELRLEEAEQKNGENFFEANTEDICHRYALALVFTNFYKQDSVIDFVAEEDKLVSLLERNQSELTGIATKVCAAIPILRPIIDWLMLHFHELGIVRKTINRYNQQQIELNFEAAKQADARIKNKSDKRQLNHNKDSHLILRDGTMFRRKMIDHVIDQYRLGKLTKREYFHSTYFLFGAADKTASDALSRLLYNLANHQDVQDRLRESIFACGEKSEYLSWVINETLRMHPPAPIGCSRTIKRDIQTKHGLVPAGTFVLTPARTIGRLRQYWGQDADEFRPERWANAKDFHPVQFLAFGAGRRACPGKELALVEIKMLMNALMRKYKFQKSALYPIDNSLNYSAPLFSILVFDTPTYVRISRFDT